MGNTVLPYPHLLAPYQIGEHVFKNRMIATSSTPFLNQGPGNSPNEAIIQHFINKAKSGAGTVIFGDVAAPNRPIRPMDNLDAQHIMDTRLNNPNEFNPDHGWFVNSGRPYTFDILNGACQNVLSNMVEAMHFYGAKVIMKMRVESPHGFDVSPDNAPDRTEIGSGGAMVRGKMLTEEQLLDVINEYGFQATLAKEIGFDGVYVHMAYGGPVTARLLSPLTNRRHDQFGIDSYENRTRFSIMALDKIKERCGKDFLTYGIISAEEEEGGYTLEDLIEFAKLFQGHLDMLHIKGQRNDLSHPTGFTRERYPFLQAAQVIKKAVPGLTIIANGGFCDLNDCEDAIAAGKVDFIGTARAWICNEDYGRLAYEGRNEDVVPCLRCNKCHISSYYRPWTSVCAVNPVWGLEHRIKDMVEKPRITKKVAIIGGGVAGMEAALTASKLGHDVTLYEKSDSLGGLMKGYCNISFKWPYQEYLAFLIRKISGANVQICLQTEPNSDTILAGQFDTIIVAIGAQSRIPAIPGIREDNVICVTDIYGKEETLTRDVIIVGGGQSGVEAGMHLAEKGHNVTVLEKSHKLAKDAPPLQYYSMLQEAWRKLPNFKGIENAECIAVSKNGAMYIDKDGIVRHIEAGTVVLAVGMQSKKNEALAFAELNKKMILVGDCHTVGNIQMAVRSGFAAAYTV